MGEYTVYFADRFVLGVYTCADFCQSLFPLLIFVVLVLIAKVVYVAQSEQSNLKKFCSGQEEMLNIVRMFQHSMDASVPIADLSSLETRLPRNNINNTC